MSVEHVERLLFRCPVCGCFKDSYDVSTGTIFTYRMCWNQKGHVYHDKRPGSRRMKPVVVQVVEA